MSWSDARRMVRLGSAAAVLAMLAAGAAGCTVRPLYGDVSSSISPSGSTVSALSQVEIKPPDSRVEQEVRNHLIFLLGQGRGPATAAPYSLDLGVVSRTRSAATIQIARENEPTAGTVEIESRYSLFDNRTGQVIASGRRTMTASFDRPQQQFASVRAERDAQNRAARELAELLRIVVAQHLEDVPPT